MARLPPLSPTLAPLVTLDAPARHVDRAILRNPALKRLGPRLLAREFSRAALERLGDRVVRNASGIRYFCVEARAIREASPAELESIRRDLSGLVLAGKEMAGTPSWWRDLGVILATKRVMRGVKPSHAVVAPRGVYYLDRQDNGDPHPLIWLNAEPFAPTGHPVTLADREIRPLLANALFHELLHLVQEHLSPTAGETCRQAYRVVRATRFTRNLLIDREEEFLPVVGQRLFTEFQDCGLPVKAEEIKAFLVEIRDGTRESAFCRHVQACFPQPIQTAVHESVDLLTRLAQNVQP